MTSEIADELDRWKQIAEEHAFSVRQSIAQRARLFEAFKLAGRVASFDNEQRSLSFSEALCGLRRTPESGSELRLSKVLRAIEDCQSQFMQDIFCLLLNQGKTNGFFVEFGACDGILISNTALLEREFWWRGILSEPAPSWHERIRKNRTCAIETRCVWSRSGEKITFGEMADDDYMTQSGIVETNLIDNERLAKRYDIETISLEYMLQQHNAPKHIDMLSVDTEGSELEILKAAPFDTYTFGFICVEHHHEVQEGPIRALLELAGYKQVLRHVSGHDGFYVQKSNPYV